MNQSTVENIRDNIQKVKGTWRKYQHGSRVEEHDRRENIVVGQKKSMTDRKLSPCSLIHFISHISMSYIQA